MTKKIQFFMIAGSMAAVAMMGCNNNDTSKPEDRVTDSATISTPVVTDTSMNHLADTSSKMVTDTATKKSTSMATPNPAKKGMKGRVNITGMKRATSASMEADKEGIYGNAEILPSYPGGEKALAAYFSKNLQYPEQASNEGVEGTVDISFVVDEKGKFSSPMIVSPKLGYGIEEEAMRVFNKMPNWNPGQIKGKNVKTRYTLPLSFQLY